jgi:hypothetical protein
MGYKTWGARSLPKIFPILPNILQHPSAVVAVAIQIVKMENNRDIPRNRNAVVNVTDGAETRKSLYR